MWESGKQYLDRGLPIIPICSHDHSGMSQKHRERCNSPGKAPILQQWSSKMETTEAELAEWFAKTPTINLGLVLGQSQLYNIVGVDIDGDLGAEAWEELEQEYEIPQTWEFLTGGGGRRLLFLLPDQLITKKYKVSFGEGHQELAFLAEGQQTVLPPSRHPSGTLYRWVPGRSFQEIDIALAPQFIIDKIKGDDGPEDIPSFVNSSSKPVTMHEYNQDLAEGNRSTMMTRFVGSLCAKRELPKETIVATAMQQNLLYCKPPLEEGEIIAMVESIWTSEQLKHQESLKRQRRREELNPATLAEMFFKEQLDEEIHWRYYSDRQTFYRTELTQGPWVQQSNDQVEAYVQTFLLDEDPSLGTNSKRFEVIRALRLYLMNQYGDGTQFDVGKNPNLKFIALPNGLLDWKTEKLSPWDPQWGHTALINAKWDPDAAASPEMKLWTDALRSWLPDERTIMFLQEYIGYSLLPSCKLRTAVFLFGDGANGKSLFIDVVLKLFEQSYAVAQPHSLQNRFGTTSLIDKMMIVCSDIDSSYLDRTGVLKQIIAGDEIRAEYKGGKDFGFSPIGKMLFSANRLPKSADRSYGWYSRLQFVPFPNRFEPDQDYYHNLISAMDSEQGRSALLHWAVDGLIRVTTNGGWTISDDMLEAKGEYRKDNDSVLAFLETFLMESPVLEGNHKTSLILRTVYTVYSDWCEDSGVKQVSQGEFSSRLSQAGYTRKPIGWKVSSGKWKTAQSIVDVAWVEDTEYDAKAVYDSYARVAL